jgi:hypothetical protein
MSTMSISLCFVPRLDGFHPDVARFFIFPRNIRIYVYVGAYLQQFVLGCNSYSPCYSTPTVIWQGFTRSCRVLRSPSTCAWPPAACWSVTWKRWWNRRQWGVAIASWRRKNSKESLGVRGVRGILAASTFNANPFKRKGLAFYILAICRHYPNLSLLHWGGSLVKL